MITSRDLAPIVHALQAAGIREDLVLCLVVVDVKDGTVTTTAPDGVNKQTVLKLALEKYDEGPGDAEFDIHPVS